ncbi:MAG: hypothetical protein LLG13_12640 [Bacteroidales bacterium]|nr:hypothetical protein [Bacteroidales bacterium]
MEHDRDYSVTIFLSTGEAKKWKYVHKLDGFVKFLNEKHPKWKYMNVYDRRKGQYIKRFYKGNPVPAFL